MKLKVKIEKHTWLLVELEYICLPDLLLGEPKRSLSCSHDLLMLLLLFCSGLLEFISALDVSLFNERLLLRC